MTTIEMQPQDGELFVGEDVKRGDAGKAKILVDLLATGRIKLVVRPIGGAGSGRTAIIDGQKLVFSQLPEGVAFAGTTSVIGNLAWIYPSSFQFADPRLAKLFNAKSGLIEEMDRFAALGFMRGELVISPRAAFGMPWHLLQDMLEEIVRTPDDIGTTVNGMGPMASCYFGRNGLRMGDLLLDDAAFERRANTAYRLAYATISGLMAMGADQIRTLSSESRDKLSRRFGEGLKEWFWKCDKPNCFDKDEIFAWFRTVRDRLRPLVRDTDSITQQNRERREGMAVFLTNGRKLHPVFGDYPMVTTSLISVHSGLELAGLPPSAVCGDGAHIIAAIKAYDSHVGEGCFPTELFDATGDDIRNKGHEFGTITGRPRRVGWLDLVSARTGMANQDFNELSVTRLDILSGLPELKICVAYEYEGRTLHTLPSDVPIERCTPVFVTVPGWSKDIARATSLADLPMEAHGYLQAIQSALGCRVTHIGTGPAQGECIMCEGV